MLVEINGTRLYVELVGDGPFSLSGGRLEKKKSEKPVLFMIHGGPGIDHSSFKKHSLDLEDTMQLVLYDLRGHGKSDPASPEECTLESAIEDLEGLRRFFSLDRINILGLSYGGMIATGYAARYGGFVNRLILIVTAPSYHFIEKAKENLSCRASAEQIAACEPMWKGEFDEASFKLYFEKLGPLYSSAIAKEGGEKSSWDDVRLTPENSNVAFRTDFWRFDYTRALSSFDCETLILSGGRDWMCDPCFSRLMASLISRSLLLEFPDSGHIVPVDENEDYLLSVDSFVKEGLKSELLSSLKKKVEWRGC